MIRIIICDDSSAWCDRAAAILEGFAGSDGIDIETRICTAPGGITDCYGPGIEPDVLFMDIDFGEHAMAAGEGFGDPNGIEAVKEINRIWPDCQVVYLTNYLSYAIDVYRTDHVWFLTKDQFENMLPEVFSKILKNNDERKTELIVKETDGSQSRILCSDIKYIERKDRKTIIRTEGGSYFVRQRISEIEDRLPAGTFGRCHTSFIVNLSKVDSISDKSLRMEDGTEILISRGYGRPFRLKYMDWAGSRMVR